MSSFTIGPYSSGPTSISNNVIYEMTAQGTISGVCRSHSDLMQLCADALDNLRLMRQFGSLTPHERAEVIVKGYQLFDRWQSLRGLPALGSESEGES